MGRRSINTTKSGKYMNPTDQARKLNYFLFIHSPAFFLLPLHYLALILLIMDIFNVILVHNHKYSKKFMLFSPLDVINHGTFKEILPITVFYFSSGPPIIILTYDLMT